MGLLWKNYLEASSLFENPPTTKRWIIMRIINEKTQVKWIYCFIYGEPDAFKMQVYWIPFVDTITRFNDPFVCI